MECKACSLVVEVWLVNQGCVRLHCASPDDCSVLQVKAANIPEACVQSFICMVQWLASVCRVDDVLVDRETSACQAVKIQISSWMLYCRSLAPMYHQARQAQDWRDRCQHILGPNHPSADPAHQETKAFKCQSCGGQENLNYQTYHPCQLPQQPRHLPWQLPSPPKPRPSSIPCQQRDRPAIWLQHMQPRCHPNPGASLGPTSPIPAWASPTLPPSTPAAICCSHPASMQSDQPLSQQCFPRLSGISWHSWTGA